MQAGALATWFVVSTVLGSIVIMETSTEARLSMSSTSYQPKTYRFDESDRRFGGGRLWGSAWGDYDSNGYADLLLNRHLGAPHLFSNTEGRLQRVTEDDITHYVDRHGCAWGEANGDARPDLYCAQGANKGKGQGPNQLLIQTTMGGFDERAAGFRVRDVYGRGRSVNWIDYDTDGDLDLFVASRRRSGYPNATFRNDRGSFRRVHIGLDQTMEGISSSWSDWDNDGDPDLLVLQYEPGPVFAFENVAGRFHSVSIPGVSGRSWQAAAWGDYDADGWTDLNLVREDRSVVMRNQRGNFALVHGISLTEGRMGAWLDQENDGDLDLFIVQGAPGGTHDVGTINRPDFLLLRAEGAFRRASTGSIRGPADGNGDSVAIADVDMDGRQDAFVTNGFDKWKGKGSLFLNRTPSGNAVTLRLRFSRWNPWAYGARVWVNNGRRMLRAELTDGFNFRSQSDVSSVHMGIGEASKARVRVRWPNGGMDCYKVAAGAIAELRPGPGCN